MASTGFSQLESNECLTNTSVPNPSNVNDNIKNDLIVFRNDEITNSQTGDVYRVIDLLGSGTFGQVFEVSCNDAHYAIKISKSDVLFYAQAQREAEIMNVVCINHGSSPKKNN